MIKKMLLYFIIICFLPTSYGLGITLLNDDMYEYHYSNVHVSKHNGQSFFNLQNNPGELGWKRKINWTGGPTYIIYNNNTLYVSCTGGIVALYQNGTEKWHYSLQDLYWLKSSPTISPEGNILFTCSYTGSSNNPVPKGIFFSLFPNGSVQWVKDYNQSTDTSPIIGPSGVIYIISESIDDDYNYNGELIALFNNGTIKWIFPFEGGLDQTSVSVSDDEVIYFWSAIGHIAYKSRLYAIWPNGTLRWEKTYRSTSYKTPVIGNNNTIYCSTGSSIFLLLMFCVS